MFTGHMESDLKILFKLTTRSRPNNALRCLDSVYANLSDNTSYEVCVSIDNDDPTVSVEFLEKLKTYNKLSIKRGDSINKIDAFNRDIKDFTFDIIVCLSDDMVVITKDFDNIIRNHFDSLDTLLHTPDGVNETLLTISIMGYDYYKKDNYIYHPSYEGLFCDNEAMEVGILRDKLKFCKTQIIKHIHPNYGQAPRDMQYLRYDKLENKDRLNYQNRKQNNFYL